MTTKRKLPEVRLISSKLGIINTKPRIVRSYNAIGASLLANGTTVRITMNVDGNGWIAILRHDTIIQQFDLPDTGGTR